MPNFFCYFVDRELMRSAYLDGIYQITIQYKIALMEGYMSRIADYSTDEHLTGALWIDGKKIYRKVISTGAVETGMNVIDMNLGDIEAIISIRFMGYNEAADLAFHVSEQTVAMDYTLNTGVWVVELNSAEDYDGGYLLVEYTKTI